jgi:hypothetical protein
VGLVVEVAFKSVALLAVVPLAREGQRMLLVVILSDRRAAVAVVGGAHQVVLETLLLVPWVVNALTSTDRQARLF